MPGHNNNDNNGSMMAEISSKHRRDIAEISSKSHDRAEIAHVGPVNREEEPARSDPRERYTRVA